MTHPSLQSAREAIQLGDYRTAIAHYQMLLSQNPSDAGLYLEMSSCLANHQQLDEALVVARQSQLYADAGFRLRCDIQVATLYLAQQRYDMAGALFEQIIRASPDSVEAHIALSNLYLKTGLPSKACAILEKIAAIANNSVQWITPMSLALFQTRQVDAAIELILNYMSQHGLQRHLLSNALMFASYSERHDSYQLRLRECMAQAYPPAPASPCISPAGTPLKVGFVSADYCWHPIGYFLHSFLPHLREWGIETYLYSNTSGDDSLTEQLRSTATRFTSIHGLNTDAATSLIRDDKLHILIDLSGHTSGHRLDVFHTRAAPVQASYLGYSESTYLPQMDYLLTDSAHILADEHEDYTEKLVYLSTTRFSFQLPLEAPAIAAAPLESNGYLTLGSFANPAKISKACATFWGKILLALPEARLKLRHQLWDDDALRHAMLQEWTAMGIAPGRFEFYGYAKYDRYLASYGEIDVILDSFPFAGGTTTCEALWMGVPTITFPGTTAAGRQGVSILTALDETDWIAKDLHHALRLLNDIQSRPDKLRLFRAAIRDKMRASPLGNGQEFARDFARALYKIVKA